MAHHSSQSDDEFRKVFGDLPRSLLGPTGKFPLGKLTASDEGETQIAIGSSKGKVVIDFGSPSVWIGFTPEQARDIAATLIKHADDISR